MTEEERQKWVLDQINDEMKKVNRDIEEAADQADLTFEEYLRALCPGEPE